MHTGGSATQQRGAVHIKVIMTGGTIAKTYDESDGSMRIARPIIETILAGLRLPDVAVSYHDLLSKDSLDLTEEDRTLIVDAVRLAVARSEAVLILHGTDTLEATGERLAKEFPSPRVPVVLTGAMRPYEFRDSDAGQNVTEALLACRLVPPGVYVAMHNRVLPFPGVVKDRKSLSFVKRS
ncbi:MAG: asparaginase domain-containing protein [Thermoplasmata archaeon]